MPFKKGDLVDWNNPSWMDPELTPIMRQNALQMAENSTKIDLLEFIGVGLSFFQKNKKFSKALNFDPYAL